ncbi:hypothetical protein PR001_g27080 [Phytophthora rubi]|uniref:Uncharacterized protein n=1 Tax=Phytophthora rubi TaxID=129364 RepID=A0A6A3HPF4_9STRA|nr:hypothetical protein PR001_g27080 [Phytophthora rubi]
MRRIRFHARQLSPAAAAAFTFSHLSCCCLPWATPLASRWWLKIVLYFFRDVFHRRLPTQRHTIRAIRGCGCIIVSCVSAPTALCTASINSLCVRNLGFTAP